MMRIIALTAATVAVGGMLYGAASGQPADTDLRRVDCSDVTIFAPKSKSTEAEICRSHGGLAMKNAVPTKQGLVILVRNQPMGGFHGQKAVR